MFECGEGSSLGDSVFTGVLAVAIIMIVSTLSSLTRHARLIEGRMNTANRASVEANKRIVETALAVSKFSDLHRENEDSLRAGVEVLANEMGAINRRMSRLEDQLVCNESVIPSTPESQMGREPEVPPRMFRRDPGPHVDERARDAPARGERRRREDPVRSGKSWQELYGNGEA